MFLSKISLNIKGKNINRFIKKIKKSKIELLEIKYRGKDNIDIIIKKSDFEKVKKLKTIYEINVLEEFGLIKIKKKLQNSIHLIVITFISVMLFILLTKTIFKIEIIHSNKEIRELLRKELSKKGIKEYSIKKNYRTLQKIKEDIQNKYPNKIEWLEIENIGTKYIIKAEERKIREKEEEKKPRNIIAKKPGIIKKVIADKGEIVKDMDDYTEKGEVIISGDLMFNNEIKGKVRAKGKVYAEIWYHTKTTYPLTIVKKEKTGKKKTTYAVVFLNKKYELSFNKYTSIKEKNIISHPLLPIKIIKETKEKLKEKSYILTYEEAIERAKESSIKEVKSKLKKPEYIIRNTYLKSNVNNSTIDVEMFFAVYEDITDYLEIGD